MVASPCMVSREPRALGQNLLGAGPKQGERSPPWFLLVGQTTMVLLQNFRLEAHPSLHAILVGGRVLRHFWLAESVPLALSLGDGVGPGNGASSEGMALAPRDCWVRLVLAFADSDCLLNGPLFPWFLQWPLRQPPRMLNNCPCSTTRMCRHRVGKAEGS